MRYKFTLLLLVIFSSAIYSCKTCECPAYSYNASRNPKQNITVNNEFAKINYYTPSFTNPKQKI